MSIVKVINKQQSLRKSFSETQILYWQKADEAISEHFISYGCEYYEDTCDDSPQNIQICS